MGWAYGANVDGREIGYGVEATCDKQGCEEEIDRGLAYACGGTHDADEVSCGRYFCSSHLMYVTGPPFVGALLGPLVSPQLCEECAEVFDVGENAS